MPLQPNLAFVGLAPRASREPPSREPPSCQPPSRQPPSRQPPSRKPPARPRLTVVWRREEPVSNRFALRDRIELLGWAAEARRFGIARVSLQHPDPEDTNQDVGDFALIYDSAGEWARWGVAREARGYLVWSPSNGNTIGYFPTLGAALTGIQAPAC